MLNHFGLSSSVKWGQHAFLGAEITGRSAQWLSTSPWLLSPALSGRSWYYSHSPDEETEAHRGQVGSPKSCLGPPGFKPGWSGSIAASGAMDDHNLKPRVPSPLPFPSPLSPGQASLSISVSNSQIQENVVRPLPIPHGPKAVLPIPHNLLVLPPSPAS